MKLKCALVCVVVCSVVVAVLGADDTRVRTADGELQGALTPDGRSRVFRGIPYAVPPVGSLRWKKSLQVKPWSGVRDALVDGAACRQTCELPPWACPTVQHEDCLYLNVFTPRMENVTTLLPVMFFIHGGDFFQGYGGGQLYDGRYLTNSSSTILVTINYRLGLFGFLGGNQTDGTVISEGNFGITDQVLALEWVQRNIEAFGGDKNRVTLFGQSAGAMSTAIHVMQPQSNLFHKAILQSEPLGIPMRSPKQQQGLLEALATKLKCPCCSADTLACIQAVDQDLVLAAQDALAKDFLVDIGDVMQLFVPFTPTIGTALIPKQPLDAFVAGEVQDIPIVMGNVAQEGNLFIYSGFSKPVSPLEYGVVVDLIFGLKHGIDISTHYPVPTGDSDSRLTMCNATTDGIFLCPNRNATRSVLASPGRKNSMWYYIFDHPPADKHAWGNETFCANVSCHGEELPFVFHAFYKDMFYWTEEEVLLSDRMMAYWTNFAHTSNPNTFPSDRQDTGDLKEWPAYETKTSMSIRFHTPTDVVDSFYDDSQCAWWDATVGYNFVDS